MKKICFVCHGNICRSVAAEIIFKNIIEQMNLSNDFQIISRATSREEIGNDIYPPMKQALLHKGYKLYPHKACQISSNDVESNDVIYYMDENNIRNLKYMFGENSKFVQLDKDEIEDPWFTDRYIKVINQIENAIKEILKVK